MSERINEQIEVLAAFLKGKILPLSFSWNRKKYSVEKINLTHASYVGRGKWYYFSVSSGDDYFKLGFDTENIKWFLEEAYYSQ